MEAKRVVFVSLKPSSSDADAGTSRGNRRKRALGIEENATWEEFTAAVCARLQIAGLRAVYHASTGERVQGVGDVQDIEDLVVEEDESVRIIPEGSTPGASPMRTPSGRYGASPSARTPLDEDEDAGGKNKPRRISVMLSNVIPGLGNAVSDKTLRELDSALDPVERGGVDDKSRRGRPNARKTARKKKRLGKRAIALAFIVIACALVYAFGRRFEQDNF